MNLFQYPNLQVAWEQIQEFIVNHQTEVCGERRGALNGSMLSLYDIAMEVDKCWVDPKFDFGKSLGYSDKKWTKLVRNYVNQDYLDLLKSEIKAKEGRKRVKNYAHAFHFDNKFGSGKDCLISLCFERRSKIEKRPIITFHTRASEITKRLIFDFLLIQRIAEYVYGKDQDCRVICHISYSFINLDCFMMYLAWKGGPDKVLTANDSNRFTHFQKKCFERYEKFLHTPIEEITYKVSARAASQVKMWNGLEEHIPTLYAKELKLFKKNPNLKLIEKLNQVYDTQK